MASRLQKLRDQRALILDHLKWIDDEIAAEAPNALLPEALPDSPVEKSPTPGIPATTPTPKPPASAIPIAPPAIPFTADATEETHVKSLKSDVRKGCLLYFGLAWVALAALTGAIYLIYG